MRHPPALRVGDPVAVIAPSSPFDRAAFDAGLARLSRRYTPCFTEGLFASARYLAGDDARRLAEFQAAMDGTARAVFCARGGYGATRLLPNLPEPAAKPLVGFSDVTALHAAFQRANRVTIHGPVVTQLGRLSEDDVEHLFTLLEDPRYRAELQGLPLSVRPTVEGRVLGGNLSVLTRMIGTPYLPNLDGAILFLEDVGERPYKLDRMWQHLAQAGCLERLVGLAFGEWTDCDNPDDVLAELVAETGLPAIRALPCGHGTRNRAFPLGARARLDSANGRLTFLEGAVE